VNIILIRHGKPTAATNPTLSAAQFAHWVNDYNSSTVAPDSVPPTSLTQLVADCYIVASCLPRASHSALLCSGQPADLTFSQLSEMALPCHKLPLILSANRWLFVNRVSWLLGFNGKVESFKLAKARAKFMAQQLQNLAQTHQRVAVFGHGLINHFIALELKKLNWQSSAADKGYWGSVQLQQVVIA